MIFFVPFLSLVFSPGWEKADKFIFTDSECPAVGDPLRSISLATCQDACFKTNNKTSPFPLSKQTTKGCNAVNYQPSKGDVESVCELFQCQFPVKPPGKSHASKDAYWRVQEPGKLQSSEKLMVNSSSHPTLEIPTGTTSWCFLSKHL